jgi:hypothetical protein
MFMDTIPRGDGPLDLLSGAGTNSSIFCLDPTVVNILRDDFGFKPNGRHLDIRSAETSGSQGSESDELPLNELVSAPESAFESLIDKAKPHEMGFLARYLILLKTIISGDYALEIAE